MSSEGRLQALLSLGYFPRELPHVFTTADFGKHAKDILTDWEKSKIFETKTVKGNSKIGKKVKFSNSYNYKLKDTEYEVISKPKRGFERRNIHLTHPVPQALLAKEISENWPKIQKYLARQSYSLDEIKISDAYSRSIKGINFSVHRAKKEFIEATSDWLVRTDITRFYPSIYTHSLTWAAYGKENVKRNIYRYSGSIADRLDVLVRHCNRNQTIGIPIGPETSWILAEIISSRIDSDFSAANLSVNKTYIDRLQDDWFVGVDTLEEAERVLSTIILVYRQYNLDINGSKTSVYRLLSSAQESWISELSSFLAHSRAPLKGGRLREFLNLSIKLQSAHLSDPVLNYALSVIEDRSFPDTDIELLESFLLKACVLSPASLDKICRILVNIDRSTKKISRDRVCARLRKLAERNLENGNTYEALWMIYAIRGLHHKLLSRRISELSEVIESSCLPLVLLDMKHNGTFASTLPKAHWEAHCTTDKVISGWQWLLAYEGIRKGWLSDRSGILRCPLFKPLDERDVVFYDLKKNVPSSRSFTKMRKAAQKRDVQEARLIIKNLRGFQFREFDDEY